LVAKYQLGQKQKQKIGVANLNPSTQSHIKFEQKGKDEYPHKRKRVKVVNGENPLKIC